MIYQMHDKHGRHLAISQPEADANLKSGWRTVTKEEFYGKKEKIEDNDPLIQAYFAKFGKMPHHKMKRKTIEDKVNAGSE